MVCGRVQLQAEAKDGEIMHAAGQRAARDAIRREQDRRSDVAKARLIDEQVRQVAPCAMAAVIVWSAPPECRQLLRCVCGGCASVRLV